MSRRTRNPFTKISNIFKQRSDPSRSTPSSLNVNVASAESPSTLLPQLYDPPARSPPTPSQPTLLPRPPSPPIPQPATPPSTIPTSLPQPLQVSPKPINHFSSNLVSSSSSPSLPNLLLSPPTSGTTPCSSLPPVSRTPTPQFGESGSFAGAHNFVIKDPHFNDYSLVGSGIDKLLKNSMPDAFHNSAARYPPPKCHLGTRTDYIAKITDWALGKSDRQEPVLWMCGPFGIGKSAVAQSCAEALQAQNKLAATLFFSRSNAGRDDPRRVFTSIAYQITTMCRLFRDIIDTRIRDDPALTMKSLSTQFEELLVHPLHQLGKLRSGIEGRIVIIDGLDECRGSPEQCEIIRIIASSARNQTTPFRWFITSRPEDPIIRTMNSDTVFPISFHLDLPVSRKIDHEILVYLTDEFEKIRKHHRLAESWPSETVLALLVDRTAGLWIYATTIVRFINDENGFGPEDQLRIVLVFLKDVSAKVGVDNPLTEIDFFYTLIMQRVPPKVKTIVRKICLLHSVAQPWSPNDITGILGLSEDQLRRSCGSIQSVMELQGGDLESMGFHFYHASFLDFMKDPERSKELCIHGDFLIEYRRQRLDWLRQVCSLSTGPPDVVFPSEPVILESWDRNRYYSVNLQVFWELCSVPNHPIDSSTAASLEKLQFRTMLQLMDRYGYLTTSEEPRNLRANLPSDLRDKIIREDRCPTSGCTNDENIWIFGHGANETVTVHDWEGDLMLKNSYPDPGRCFCGSQIQANSDSGHEGA